MKILLIDRAESNLAENFCKAGYDFVSLPDIQRAELLDKIADYDALIVRSKTQIDKEVIDKAVSLKAIGRLGAGMEAINTEYAQKKGIKCFNSPEGNRDAVGEHALGMLLALFDNICRANNEVKQGLWRRKENMGIEIKGKTVGIIGFGNMGSAFAKRLMGFECNIIAYDKYKTGFGNDYIKEESLERLFEKAQILSLHVPLTEETAYMGNESFFNSFSHPFYLINTSRGRVVRTRDLVSAMRNGKILGAALDVLEYEGLNNEYNADSAITDEINFLRKADNVVLTPHVAGWSIESEYRHAEVLSAKMISYLDSLQ
ncbi:MAG: hypothetical protein LBL74_05345 [Bacteroidales bacterium]|jgi:D-3-phosphoglycerate dehydrogenase|nr:hypothetical protein [Bacteroidales bacterium]